MKLIILFYKVNQWKEVEYKILFIKSFLFSKNVLVPVL